MLDKFWTLYDRSPLATILGVIASVAFALILLLFCISRANAADATLTWTHPTTFTDGTPIPATGTGAITATDLEYGLCNAAKNGFGATAVIVSVPAPATTRIVTGLGNGSWCFHARTNAGAPSAWTGFVAKDVVLIPNPPVLAVPVIAGMLQTPVYSVASTGKMSTFVGFADVGTQCNGPVLFTYRSKAFREVARASVKLWGSTTLRLAAPCA
jgi:hypothetical protein